MFVSSGARRASILLTLSSVLLMACATSEPAVPPPPPAPRAEALPPGPPVLPAENTIIPGSRQDFQVNVGDSVFFAYDRSDIDDMSRDTLQKQAAWLERYPAVTLMIEGHADERGTREYNLALSARRANSAKEYLTSLGVSPRRLDTIAYGKERPVCVESNESCWAQNRRAVSIIPQTANIAMQ
jgi:peptidoglycan-associated lipoprotein